MSKIGFFILTAIQNIHRGGQRTLVAFLCITFGVMSLVSMTMLSKDIAVAMLVDARTQVGGDLAASSPNQTGFQDDQLAVFGQYKEQGLIDKYSLVSEYYSLTIRKPGSGKLDFTYHGIGIEPDNYPLVGSFTVSEPQELPLTELLNEFGEAIISRDIASSQDLNLRDKLILSELGAGRSVEVQITGIIEDTPDHSGGSIYYNLETAAALKGSGSAINLVRITTNQPDTVRQLLKEQSLGVQTPQGVAMNRSDAQELIELSLKGAGFLGLLVGGIGIAYTLQVLLARRNKEIAIYKALGYSQGDMLWLFILEAALLGIVGSVLGIVIAIGIEYWFLSIFNNIITVLLVWNPAPIYMLSGLLIGIGTTVLFAVVAIIRNGSINPSALLRNERIESNRSVRSKTLLTLLAIMIPFTTMAVLIMGSIRNGVGVILFTLAGLTVLGGIMYGLLQITTKLLPVSRFPLLHMARNSLRRRGSSLIFAMIALFAGVVTLGFSSVAFQSASQELDARTPEITGANLTVIANADTAAELITALTRYAVDHKASGYYLEVASITAEINNTRSHIDPILAALSHPVGYFIQGSSWGNSPEGVYVNSAAGLQEGSQIKVTNPDGNEYTFPVVGTYNVDYTIPGLTSSNVLLMGTELLQTLGDPETIRLFLHAPEHKLTTISTELGQAFPEALVINHEDYLSRHTQTYKNLFILAVSMAGLALLAGILLIANAVSMAMIERRYEIGVCKAVGFSRSKVLTTLVLEFSLVALIAVGVGLAAVQLILIILARINNLAADSLTLESSTALFTLIFSVVLTTAAVIGFAWMPTRLSPSIVLNNRTI